MPLAGSLAAALLATLSRPAWWAMALAGFLVRGGVLLLLLPIVHLPTSAGLANELSPLLIGFVFAGPSAAFIGFVGAVVVATLAWLVASGLFGGWFDLALIRGAADDEDLEGVPPPRFGDAFRAFQARIVAHVPTAAVLAWGAGRLVDAAYEELIHPGDATLSVPVRVALRIPEVVGLLAGAWILGEAVGGLAVRHVAWGDGLPRALVRSVRALARSSAAVTFVLTNGLLAVAIVGSAAATGIAWGHLRVTLLDGGAGAEVGLALVVFSLTWVAAVWLLSLTAAWRATAWTYEVARHLPPRTIEPAAR